MCNESVFCKYDTSYESINAMITGIALKLVGNHPSDEYLDELLSEGWMIVIETLPGYVPERGNKLTTYLWMAVYGGMIRYIVKKTRRESIMLQNDKTTPVMTTESVPNSGIYEGNPYLMQPDTVYEKLERAAVWEQVCVEHRDDICDILQKTPKHCDLSMRKTVSRNRKRKLSQLQASVKLMLS